jgi:hypothetical protein
LTSALVGGEWPLYPGERATGIYLIGGWVDPGAAMDDVKERKFLTLPGLELRSLGRLARSYTDYAIPDIKYVFHVF